jgi:hypothetical protein
LLGFQHPFWFRHHHDELYKRWAEELSQSKVTLVIVDDANPNAQYESFGKLLGVPSGVIRASSLRNTSMKQLQADTLLQVHKILRAEGWSTPRFKKEEFMKYLKQAGYIPDQDVPILLPEWAKFEVGEISESVAAVLQQPGVRLMGDVSLLESNRIRTANPSYEIEDSASMLAMQVVFGVSIKDVSKNDDASKEITRRVAILNSPPCEYYEPQKRLLVTRWQ